MSSTPLDAQALVAWLKGASVQGETGQLNKEMAIVMTQVQQMVSHPTQRQVSTGSEFSGVSSTSGGSMSPLPWVGSTPLVIGAIVWVIGTLRILRKPLKTGDSHMIA